MVYILNSKISVFVLDYFGTIFKFFPTETWIHSRTSIVISFFGGNLFTFKNPSKDENSLTVFLVSLPDMFCFQCEQSKLNKHCTEIGVCGKTPQVAALQDLLLHVVKGVCLYSHRARELGVSIDHETYSYTLSTLFR